MHKIKVLFTGVAILLSYLVSVGSNVLEISCSSPELRAQVLATAIGELHVREDIAPNDALRIRHYKLAINSRFNEPVSWCGIYAAYCFVTNGVIIPKGAEWVPSWSADKSKVIYHRGKANNQHPCPGDAVTFYYPSKKREAHIGIVKEWPVTGDYFYTIEGNTNRAGSRNGDGVYVKMRRKTDAYKIVRLITGNRSVSFTNGQTSYKIVA